MSRESLEKAGNYEQMVKQISDNAKITGRRKPVYINYTKDGRLKEQPVAGLEDIADEHTESI